MRTAKKDQDKRTLSEWLTENPVLVLTIVGASFYVALRFAHQAFYRPLGLTPEDVGLGYGEALGRAAGIAFYATAFSIVFLVPALRLRRRGHPLMPFLLWLYITPLLTVLIAMWRLTALYADDVQDGKTVHPVFLIDTGVRAEKADISWTEEPPKGMKSVPRHRLMYLGESEGSVVLYDVDAKRSLRIPSSSVAVSIVP